MSPVRRVYADLSARIACYPTASVQADRIIAREHRETRAAENRLTSNREVHKGEFVKEQDRNLVHPEPAAELSSSTKETRKKIRGKDG